MNNYNDQNKYIRAKERVAELKKFYTSLMWYVIFIPFLAWINYATNHWSYAWFLWAAFGWGIGLVFQGLKAYRVHPMFNKDWEERKIKEFIKREEQQERSAERWD